MDEVDYRVLHTVRRTVPRAAFRRYYI